MSDDYLYRIQRKKDGKWLGNTHGQSESRWKKTAGKYMRQSQMLLNLKLLGPNALKHVTVHMHSVEWVCEIEGAEARKFVGAK